MAEQTFDSPLDQEFADVSDCRNLDATTPAFLRFHMLNDPIPTLAVGTILRYRQQVHGLPLNWPSRIIEWGPPRALTDEQLHGPLRRWTHRNRVRVCELMRLSLCGHWRRRTPVCRGVARDLERFMRRRQAIPAGQWGGAR
ncbi:MAG TPA: hypothetical protein VNN55_09205 [bacterium]|nr:hypothetical protein [bacterium]